MCSQRQISTQFHNCLPCRTKYANPSQVRRKQLRMLYLLLMESTGHFTCSFGTGHGYALVLTQSHAVIWPYLSSASSPSPAEVFTLSVPESCRNTTAEAPHGVLLSTATTGPPALMVIIPSTGKIVYWETVSNATSFGLSRHKQNGLQGSISGLLYGENITEVVNGEPSGVIATLSSGRVVQITVRSSQGKPTIVSNFLRNSTNGSMGLLGGIRNALVGGFWRKEVAAVRPGVSRQRGQRDILVATTNGHVEVWDTHWSNGSILRTQFDIRQHLAESLGPMLADESGDYTLKILDLASGAGNDSNVRGSQAPEAEKQPLYFVVELPQGPNSTSLWVVRMILSDDGRVWSTRLIDLHHTRSGSNESKLRLFVSKIGDTGFIVVGQSIIVLSLAQFDDTIAPQDSHSLPLLFSDKIDLRTGNEYEILGSGFEEAAHHNPLPACFVMVRGFGVVRVSAVPRQCGAGGEHVTTAKHKLEQAVFYGTMVRNPLDLASRGGLDFPVDELEQAALEICRELLQSNSRYIPSSGIPLDQNLRSRAKALDDLASLLTQRGLPFNNPTQWELLWGAEKLAAQRAMWKIEGELRRKNADEPTFLSRVIDQMSEKFKTKFDSRHGDSDYVRHWFLHDTYRMEHIIPWIFNAIKPQKGQSKQGRKMAEQIFQASEFSLAVLETAFRFRDEHASLYGLNEEFLEEGVLVTGYEDLPEPWTSHNMAYVETGHLLDLELGSCMAWIQQTMCTVDAPSNDIVKDISKNCARQLRVLSQMHGERIRWLSSQGDPKSMDEIVSAEQSHVKQRRWQLFKLAGIGQLDGAISLAEKFRDMSALVELIIELQDQTKCQLFSEINSDDPDAVVLDKESGELGRKISHYFEKFGESWANAFFSRQISMGQSGVLFAMRKFQPFVTRFLRKNPAYQRLSWVNDVVGENDYSTAAQCLKNLAIEQESDLWSHRVELSLGKLSSLAAWESTGSAHSTHQSEIKRLEDYAELDAVQEVIHAHITPALQDAIDQRAETDLAVEQFGGHIAEHRPSLHEVLANALTRVVAREVVSIDQLVDLLTLLDTTRAPDYEQTELPGKEFYLALRAIRLGCCGQRDQSYTSALQKLVWRRCMIRDSWEGMGTRATAEGLSNEAYDTALFHTLVLCLKDRKSLLSSSLFLSLFLGGGGVLVSDHITENENDNSLYVPISPTDVTLSESELDVLCSQFRSEQRAQVARDLVKESETLCRYMELGNLEFWFKDLLSFAQVVTASPGEADD